MNLCSWELNGYYLVQSTRALICLITPVIPILIYHALLYLIFNPDHHIRSSNNHEFMIHYQEKLKF